MFRETSSSGFIAKRVPLLNAPSGRELGQLFHEVLHHSRRRHVMMSRRDGVNAREVGKGTAAGRFGSGAAVVTEGATGRGFSRALAQTPS